MPSPNLVQIQRDLQMLPPGPQTMMYLKRAKDGMVASVPPYLAAAELAGREKMAQRQAMSDGAVPGEQPTVSQQLSQKADLLALQAMKKQAMEQQSANQAREAVMPAPEGTPEPEEQPRREGGIDQLPVDFGLAGGGIVAFTPGGTVSTEAEDISGMLPQAGQLPKTRKQLEEERQREERQREEAERMAFLEASAPELAARMKAEQAARKQAVNSFVAPTGNMQQIEAAAQQRPPAAPPAPPQQRPPAAPAAPAAQAAPAAPSPQQSVEAALMQRLGLAPGGAGLPALLGGASGAAPTMAGTAGDVKAAQAQFGLDKAAGAEERRLIEQMQALQAQRAQGRARRDLREVLLGFGRGYGGAAAASIGAGDRAYAEDMQHQQQMYNLINALNTGNRKEAEKAFEKTVGLQQQRETDLRSKSNTELQALTSMYGNMLQAGSSRYNTDMHFKAAMLQAARAEASGNRADKEQSINTLRVLLDGQVKELTGISAELRATQVGPARKEIKERYDRVERELNETRARLKRLEGVPDDAPTSGTAPTTATKGRVVNWADIK
jgi:hypothetical protein